MKPMKFKLFVRVLRRMVMPFLAILIALIVTGLIILATGFSPITVYKSIVNGAFGNTNAWLSTLFYAMPILLTGLAYSIGAKCGFINIGIEGQLCAGAFAATLAGIYVTGLPGAIHPLICLLAAGLAGGLCAGIVAFMHIRYDANSFITSIMLNMIVLYITSYFVSGPLRAAGDVVQTKQVQETARLLMLSERNQLSVGIIIAVIFALILAYVFKYTIFGFEMNAVGMSPSVARYAGISINTIVVKTMLSSGFIAGLSGAICILGSMGRYIDGFSPGYGYDGIAVSTLAGGNPLGCIFSALLFGGLKAGAIKVNILTRVPIEFVDLLQAIVIVLIAAPKLVAMITGRDYMNKRTRNRTQETQKCEAKHECD